MDNWHVHCIEYRQKFIFPLDVKLIQSYAYGIHSQRSLYNVNLADGSILSKADGIERSFEELQE